MITKGGMKMAHPYYRMCCDNIGKVACIRSVDGRVFSARINGVTPTHIHLSPVGRGIEGERQEESKIAAKTADATLEKKEGSEVLFFFPFFFPLASIAAIAFAAAARPYGYGYGRRRFYY
jgi:hypothetical protein